MAQFRFILKWILIAPVAIVIVLFSIANRAPVTVSFDPIMREAPALSATIPLYLVVLAAIALGVIAGGLGAWFAQGRHRKAERTLRRETQILRADAERFKASLAARPPLPAP